MVEVKEPEERQKIKSFCPYCSTAFGAMIRKSNLKKILVKEILFDTYLIKACDNCKEKYKGQ